MPLLVKKKGFKSMTSTSIFFVDTGVWTQDLTLARQATWATLQLNFHLRNQEKGKVKPKVTEENNKI
jgi:hypothetical protein